MPKKRVHFKQYSKPQSTAPASLSSTAAGAGSHNGESESRSVNQRLAELRRLGVNSNSNAQGALDVRPTVPPVIRDILQLPETPAPRPRPGRGRGGPRVDATGRRLPPGPAPPQSWLNRPAHGILSTVPRQSGSDGRRLDKYMLPELYLPAKGSLIDLTLRQFAHSWDFQREYCRYYLYQHLPTHLREALVAYLSIWKDPGNVTLADLKAILLPPQKQEGDDVDEDAEQLEEEEEEEEDYLDPSIANKDFRHLDLSHSIGTSLSLRELTDLLFPPKPSTTKPITAASLKTAEPRDSWEDSADEEDEFQPEPSSSSIPRPLLPNLTHLSLSLPPNPLSSSTFTTPGTHHHHPLPSWRHLLSFASHHPTLTHLSLANWPEPSLTPNAKYASFVTAQGRRVQYGGTGPYSHSLDNDWSEAILVLRRLSRAWYRLEWLDLRGCGGWWEALWAVSRGPMGDMMHLDQNQDFRSGGGGREREEEETEETTTGGGEEGAEGGEEGDRVDWRVDWGKVETVVLGLDEAERGKFLGGDEKNGVVVVEKGKKLERHVRGLRKGRGRWFAVC
ncbi:uncharacterized protein B0T23DRAFT_241952 [Neurospora hispaniola]|uniref:Uncharacterized protein n=1 Tax=Neurospora hispaniola TaxID=588809 RepID=A0AAJ0MMA1_9PEZI|nr:hypothetical protein B0T23DRAFT_241952 [Neurospora hispaniola]